MQIVPDDPHARDVAALLGEHLEDMARHSPAESIHSLDLDELCAPEVTFWTVRDAGALIGCAALLELAPDHGEIKSMRTARPHRGRKVAATLLEFMIDEARRRKYRRLSLETGSGAPFAAAHALYRKFGFLDCGPFRSYREDPFSRYMTLEL